MIHDRLIAGPGREGEKVFTGRARPGRPGPFSPLKKARPRFNQVTRQQLTNQPTNQPPTNQLVPEC